MAHYDATHSHIDQHSGSGFFRILTAPFRGVWYVLVNIAESNAAIRRVDRLNAMSDEELARRGLRREDIVREVFFDSGYL